jgi:hypothetical protein
VTNHGGQAVCRRDHAPHSILKLRGLKVHRDFLEGSLPIAPGADHRRAVHPPLKFA